MTLQKSCRKVTTASSIFLSISITCSKYMSFLWTKLVFCLHDPFNSSRCRISLKQAESSYCGRAPFYDIDSNKLRTSPTPLTLTIQRSKSQTQDACRKSLLLFALQFTEGTASFSSTTHTTRKKINLPEGCKRLRSRPNAWLDVDSQKWRLL